MDIIAFCIGHAGLIGFALLFVKYTASALLAITPTPAPGTVYAKIYRAIEVFNLTVGYAKDRGILAPSPAAVQAADNTVAVIRAVIAQQHASALVEAASRQPAAKVTPS